jgi:hypothetical protein
MVVEYWKAGPSPTQLAAMPPSTDPAARTPLQDLQVDFATVHNYNDHYLATTIIKALAIQHGLRGNFRASPRPETWSSRIRLL